MISQESFLRDVNWLNEFKIRGSWGKLGSISNINPTNAYTLYGQQVNQSYYDINGTSHSSGGRSLHQSVWKPEYDLGTGYYNRCGV